MKICFKCRKPKPLRDFYRHPRMGDGRLGKCKECAKRDVRRNRKKRKDHYIAFDKQRNMLPHRVEARKHYQKTRRGKRVALGSRLRWIAKNPEKRKAHHAANNAVRDGKLKKRPCEVCGTWKRVHKHHADYSKPLDVQWLCPKHHTEAHRRMAA